MKPTSNDIRDEELFRQHTHVPSRWWIVAILACFTFVSYLQRTNISIAAEFMMPELGLSKIQMGQIFSSFLIGYAIFQIPGGLLGDSIGPRSSLGVSAVIWGIATASTGLVSGLNGTLFVSGFFLLWLIRFVLGLAEATTYPVGSSVVYHAIAPEKRALGNSLMMMGTSVGAASASPIMSWLMVRLGWHQAFFLTSLPAFAVALLWFIFAPSSKRAKQDSPRQKLLETDGVSLHKVLTSKRVVLLCLSYVSEGYVLFLFVFWLYIYLVEIRKFSVLKGGFVAALPWIAGLCFTPLGGWLCDRIGLKRGRVAGAKYVIMAGYSLSGLLLFVAAYASQRSLCIAALCLSVGFLMAAESPFWACATSFSGKHAGTVSGVMNTAGILGGILSTSIIPVLVAHYGWLIALGSGAAMAFFCSLVWIAIGAEREEPSSVPGSLRP